MKKIKAWAVISDDTELCFATEEDNSPLAVFSEEFDGKVSATVLARDIGVGTKVVPCTITY